MPEKERLLLLGDVLGPHGTSEGSWTNRLTAANRVWYRHRGLMTNKKTALMRRLAAFVQAPGSALEYSTDTWHLGQETLQAMLTWENKRVRELAKMRFRPMELRKGATCSERLKGSMSGLLGPRGSACTRGC